MAHIETGVRGIASAFVNARRTGLALTEYPGVPPLDLAHAYAVQDAAMTLFDEAVGGWKVGRINPPWTDQLQCTRLSGPIFTHSVQSLASDDIAQGQIFESGFGAAEAEFVFRIGQVPDPAQKNFSLEDAAALVDAVFCGVEIASSPFSGINSMGPLVTISDFGNNNGLLVGTEIPDWQASGLENWDVSTVIDGTMVGAGTAATFPGGPLESVRFLLENLIMRGRPVMPGLLISSGAVTGVHEVTAGQLVEVRFGSFCKHQCVIGHKPR